MYYYIDSQNKPAGPVPTDQLEAFGVTPETYVWKRGMPQWTKACEVEELGIVFNSTHIISSEVINTLEHNQSYNKTGNCVNKWIASVLTAVIITLTFTVCVVYSYKKQTSLSTTANEKLESKKNMIDTISENHQTLEIIKTENHDIQRVNNKLHRKRH